MQRVVNFYEKLPRGSAPQVKATGILGRYQAKHFGKNPTAKRMFFSHRYTMVVMASYGAAVTDRALAIIHAIGLLLVVGYAQNYYFHLRKSLSDQPALWALLTIPAKATTRTTLTKRLRLRMGQETGFSDSCT